nr:hypothetical protein GCM10020092_033060 [Actinoplanes digitatis]
MISAAIDPMTTIAGLAALVGDARAGSVVGRNGTVCSAAGNARASATHPEFPGRPHRSREIDSAKDSHGFFYGRILAGATITYGSPRSPVRRRHPTTSSRSFWSLLQGTCSD